jgi:hypothetical protein
MWRRHRYKFLIIASLVIASTIVSLIATHRTPEPTYKGLTIAQWLSVPQTTAQEEAIVSLGTDNLQLFVRQLNYEPTKDRIYVLYSRLPARIKNVRLLDDICARKRRKAAEAYVVILLLGHHAAPAVPELSKLARNASQNVAGKAVFLLGNIGEWGVPGILEGMSNTNQNVRNSALFTLGRFSHSQRAWHAITNALNDTDFNTRQQAARIVQMSGRALQ